MKFFGILTALRPSFYFFCLQFLPGDKNYVWQGVIHMVILAI